MMLAENARAVIGHNNPPPDEDESEREDKSPPTIEEARVVAAAISYLQYKVPGLEDILVKRKGGRVLGWRHVASNCLKGRVRRNSLAVLLGNFDDKLTGESQQRPDAWAEYDDEHGSGQFGVMLAQVRDAIQADSHVDVPAMDAMVKAFVKADPHMRKMETERRLEEQRQAHAAAAAEAERAAARLEHAAVKRAAEIAKVEAVLRGVPKRDAILAQQRGPTHLAASLSDEAMAVVEKTVKAEAKGARRSRSALNPKGLQECIKLGLARESQPYLAPPSDDPPISPTELAMRVFTEAMKIGRIEIKKKATRAERELDEMEAKPAKLRKKR